MAQEYLHTGTTEQHFTFQERWSQFIDKSFKYWALLPTAFILIVLTLFPLFQLFRMTVSEVSIKGGTFNWTYVGINKHLQNALVDPVIPAALQNTLIFVVVVVIVEMTLALLFAIAVSRTTNLSWLYRTALLLPILLPPIAIGTMWRLMYDFNYGFINQVLALGGIVGPTWTADPKLALPAVMLVDIWHWTSFLFLILLAGLESLPHDLSEAAQVDGATEFQVYRYIFLPLLRPTIIVALMLRTIFAFKVFDEIFLLTGGGPGTATQVISMYIYEVYFVQFRLGYGAFLALGAALLASVFVIFYQWLNRSVGGAEHA